MLGPGTIGFALLLSCAFAQTATAQAQLPEPVPESTLQPAPSPFLLEPEPEIEGNRIKSETYRTQPTGQNQNWNLDIGRFQPKINDDPNGLAQDDKQGYSGLRLRLPLRGGISQ